MYLKEVGCGMDSFDARWGLVVGSRVYGNESSCFIKCWEFLDWLSDLASQGGLCSMELEKLPDHSVCCCSGECSRRLQSLELH
jgi:hypothetical protein